MISKITVKSFKSLEDVTVELGTVNVFVGANGSGKTNLLEVVGVLGAAAFGRVDDESLLRRGVRPGVPQLYKSAFPRKRAENVPHIFLSAENSKASYQVSLWNPQDDPEPAWRFKSEVLRIIGGETIAERGTFKKPGRPINPDQGLAALKLVDLLEGNPARSLLDLLREYAIYCANTPTLRGLSPDQQLRQPIGLSGGRLPEAAAALIRETRNKNCEWPPQRLTEMLSLIDWAEAFGSAASDGVPLSPSAAATRLVVRFKDRFMAKKRNFLTGYDASEGALYILFAAVLILHPKSAKFLAVDNIDQSLNPVLAKRLSKLICAWTLESKSDKQILLTAHNPAVLDGLPLQDDRVRLFTVDRDHRGHTVVKRVPMSQTILAKAEQGWTLSRLWMNGLIGGVPDV